MNKQHWQDWVTGIVGAWLIVSPWALRLSLPKGMSTAPMTWTFVLTGIVVLALAIAALAFFRLWEEGGEVIVGVWLIVSPWIMHFTASSAATVNAVIMGAIIVGAAAWTMAISRKGRTTA